jgi:hypothetical protein
MCTGSEASTRLPARAGLAPAAASRRRAHAPGRRRGLSLVSLIFLGLVVLLLFVLGLRVVPAFTEYLAIERAVARVGTEGATVREIRSAFDRYATLDDIKSIAGRDLDITKDGDRIVVSYAYTYSVPLLKNVRLVIDFTGSSNGPSSRNRVAE